MNKKKKLALNKETIKSLKVNTEIKTGATGGCNDLSQQITCSRVILTQSCQVGTCNPNGTIGPTIGC